MWEEQDKEGAMANRIIKLVLCTKCQKFIGNGIEIVIYYLILKFKEGKYNRVGLS